MEFTLNVRPKNTGIIFLEYIYLVETNLIKKKKKKKYFSTQKYVIFEY